MKLPCKHIFALRKRLEVDLFAEELCDVRWSFKYYKENQRIFRSSSSVTVENDSPAVTISDLPVSTKRPMSQVYTCMLVCIDNDNCIGRQISPCFKDHYNTSFSCF